MAEPTNPGQPSDSSTERGSPVNVNTTGNVSVTRKNVATGDMKDEQTELLRQLIKCCDEQTHSLKKLLKDTKNEITDAVLQTGGGHEKDHLANIDRNIKSLLSKGVPGGGGGEGGGGGGGGESGSSYAAAQAASKMYDASQTAADIFERTGLPAFSQFFNLFKKGAAAEFERNMLNINQKLIDFGQSLMDVQSATRKTMGVIDQMFKAGQGGMVGINALYEDLGAGLLKNRDALNSTFPIVMEFAEQQKLLIGTLGSNLEEVSRTFKLNREAAQEAFGNEFLERIPFEELNTIQTQILQQQRRAGVQASNAEILTSRQTRDQIQLLKDIAFATGKTVAEVMKLQEDDAMTLEELRFNGLISQQTLESMRAQRSTFQSMGLTSLSDLMQEIVEAGGVDLFQRREGAALMMSQGDNDALVRELFALSQGAAGGTPEGQQRMIELAAKLEGLTGQTAEAASFLREDSGNRFQALAETAVKAEGIVSAQAALIKEGKDATLEAVREAQKATEGDVGGTVQGLFNSFQDVIKNNLGGGGDLAIALGLNTAAVIANTFAHGGGGLIKGMFKGGGKMLGKVKGMLGFGSVAAATAAGASTLGGGPGNAGRYSKTAEATAKASGKATAKAAAGAGVKSILKKIPIVGLLMGLGLGAARAMEGDFVGAGGEVLSGAASLVPGLGTAASVAIDAGLLARDLNRADEGVASGPVPDKKGISPSPGDKATVAPTGVNATAAVQAPRADTVYAQLVAQTSHLSMLVGLITQGNETRDNMLDSLDQIGSGGFNTGKLGGTGMRRGKKTEANTFSPLDEFSP